MTTPYINPNLIFASNAPVKDKPAAFANYDKGWDESRKNEGRPSIKQMNYLTQQADLKNLYLHENGAALPYKEGIAYEENAHVVKDGELVKLVDGEWVKVIGESTDSKLITWSGLTQEQHNKQHVTPFDFGVIDGFDTDNTESLRKYHDYCNLNNLSASYAGLKEISIQANAKIQVNTNLFSHGCSVKLLNAVKPTPASKYVTYVVMDPNCPSVSSEGIVLDKENLTLHNFFPSKGFYNKTGFISISSPFPMCNRDRNGAMNFEQTFWLVNGQAVLPLSQDISEYNTVNIISRDASRLRVIINPPCLIDDGFNNQTFFSIERNQVDFDELIIIETESRASASLDDLIKFTNCGDWTVKNLKIQAMPYSSSLGGTYGLRLSRIANARLINCRGVNGVQSGSTWGVTGSNYVNGLYVDDCSFNRIDIHAMGFNIFVNGGSYNKTCLMVGNGGGIFSIGGKVQLFDCPAFRGRTDYGAHYVNSTIIVGDVIVSASNIDAPVIDFSTNNSIGGPVAMQCPDIIIDGLKENPSVLSQKMIRLMFIHVRKGSTQPVYPPSHISINNIELNQRTQWNALIDFASFEQNDSLLTSTRLTVKGINSYARGSYISNDGGLGVIEESNPKGATNKIKLRVIVSDCLVFGLKMPTINPVEVRVSNSRCSNLYTPPTEILNYSLSNVTMMGDDSFAPVKKILGRESTNKSYTRSINGLNTIGSTSYDISSANYIIGAMVESKDTLPTSCTVPLAFTGYISA